MSLNYNPVWGTSQASSLDELSKEIEQATFSLLNGKNCLDILKKITHRSVGSHFLHYIDFIFRNQGQNWGYSLFSEAFIEVFRDQIKTQNYKGSVIFLGENHFVAPTLSALAQFGFQDFVFLELSDPLTIEDYSSEKSGIFNISVSKVNSQAFVQSQKEYSLCFVMQDEYPQQTLEDMSYFHFLSNQSMVFDLSGNSNFFFDEVKALGVEAVLFDEINAKRALCLQKMIKDCAKNLNSSK